MAQKYVASKPLDPNLYTGEVRLIAGPVRTGNVTTNTFYGENGRIEFACWLWVGVAGDVSYTKWDGTDQVLPNVQAGMWHHIYSVKINTTGTTATGMVWGS